VISRSALALACVVVVAGACADPPVVEAPGAQAVLVGRSADAVGIAAALDRAGLVRVGPVLNAVGAALVGDAPVVASLLPDGVVVVSTLVGNGADAAASFGEARPVLGKTRALVVDGKPVLVRADRHRVIAAIGVPEGREASVASMIEVLAEDKSKTAPNLPPSSQVELHVAAGVLPVDPGPLHATLALEGMDLRVDAVAPSPPPDLAAALAAPSPPWTCPLEAGAGVVVHVPPLPGLGGDDGFRGRMFLAIYPPATNVAEGPSIVLAGEPVDEAALDADLADLEKQPGVVVAREGAGRVIEVRQGRHLRVIRAPKKLVVAVGDRVPLGETGDARPCPEGALIRANTAELTRLLLPLVFTREAVLGALLTGDVGQVSPLAALRGVSHLDVDATRDGEQLRIHARVGLVPVTD
jgi:hypothetical protein